MCVKFHFALNGHIKAMIDWGIDFYQLYSRDGKYTGQCYHTNKMHLRDCHISDVAAAASAVATATVVAAAAVVAVAID